MKAMCNTCLLLALLTAGCDTSHQSVNIDKSSQGNSVRQLGNGSSQTVTIQGVTGNVSATQTDALSATTQTVNTENVAGDVSVAQSSTGWGNAQTMNIRNAKTAKNISQSQSGFFNKQTMNVGNAQ